MQQLQTKQLEYFGDTLEIFGDTQMCATPGLRNTVLEERNLGLDEIVSYEKIFDFGGAASATLIKLKIINEFIQIERPKHFLKSKILTIINLPMNTEKYIAIKNKKIEKFEERWKPFL